MRNPRVIYEDTQVLVIDKPFGMVVNRAESVTTETLQDWVEGNFQFSIFNFQLFRSGIVHRLDKDTSGVMVIAKTKSVFEDLQSQFKQRKIEKTYVALLHGRLEPKEGVTMLPLGRSGRDRKKFTVTYQGKQSETKWSVIKYLRKENEWFTLVELYPKTGRTHQLRVHLKHLGYPIVGDSKYLGKKRARSDAKWSQRQFLHAKKLCFYLKGSKKCFEVDLAVDLKRMMSEFKK